MADVDLPAARVSDWQALQSAIAGDVVLPGSVEYDLMRTPAIGQFHEVRRRR